MKKVILRIFLILPAIILQTLFYIAIFNWLSKYSSTITTLTSVISFLMVLYILDKRMESNYKTIWLIIIFIFPAAGAWLYLLCGYFNTAREIDKRMKKADKLILPKTDQRIVDTITNDNERMAQSLRYLARETNFPVVYMKDYKFYSLVDEAFDDIIDTLKKATKSIYIETFIIEDGYFWSSIENVLKEKAKEGIEVYVLYDDIGSMFTYSPVQMHKLHQEGINCVAFNPVLTIRPLLNNRDHRKMIIIDNETLFTGGFNLADEYINKKVVHGHWKDIGVCMHGDIVHNYTAMFVEMWNSVATKKIDPTKLEIKTMNEDYHQGYVVSYYDSPAREQGVSNALFIDFLSQAHKRAWFYTPYLILNDSLRDALIQCAKRGVDVRIITPGVPDHLMVQAITRSNYDDLIMNGVHVYEYTPGFVHAKGSIFDDNVATIGSVNLDYRSLFLHYECNCVFYETDFLETLAQDYEKTQAMCKEMSVCPKHRFFHNLWRSLLKVVAPFC